MTLQEAYDEKLIDINHLKSIAYYLNGTMFDDFTPYEKDPAELSKSIINKIKRTKLNSLKNQVDSSGEKVFGNIKLDDINIKGYYGTYNCCIALRIDDTLSNYPAVESVDTVDEVSFYYTGAPVVIFIFN